MQKLQEIAVSLAVDYLLPPLKKAVSSSFQPCYYEEPGGSGSDSGDGGGGRNDGTRRQRPQAPLCALAFGYVGGIVVVT